MKKRFTFFVLACIMACWNNIKAQPEDIVPTVVTNPNFARGATMAFGRSTITGVAVSELLEHGFCWSTNPEPTVQDNCTTQYLSNNGFIYKVEDLKPATVYYMRAYAITQSHAVSYGDVIKVITIPKGTITYTYNNGASADANERISNALESATSYWNNLTSIQGFHVTCNYGSGTPTADCGYGGGMRIGPNAGYQRTGTVMHEMGHGIGVGTHTIWYGPNSPLREKGSKGIWLGERATKVVQFWDNDSTATMRGDATHMWPYGINGAHEDNGSELLYIGNSLITQALGEDGLPPTGGFATPAYTFGSEDNVKYYIKNEAEIYGLHTSYLMENKSGELVWKVMPASTALTNDSTAWHLEFAPSTCYYRIRNASTGKYFTYNPTNANGIGLTIKTPEATENFQLMGGRVNIVIGNNTFTSRGYWIICPKKQLNPPCLAASANGLTGTTSFNIANTATAQRWLILTADQIDAFETADDIILTDLKINGQTIPGFSYKTTSYTYNVAPDAEADSFTVTAEKASKYDGVLDITQTSAIPGKAFVKATGADHAVTTYTINFVKNYLYRWDGNGIAGAGSEPNAFGWDATPSVTWGTANGAANRYMDAGNGEYVGYTLDGNSYDRKRILWIRYNNNEEYTYAFNSLKARSTYKLSLNYGWHNNGVAPNLTIGIYEKSTKTLIAQAEFASSNIKRALKSGELEFTVPADIASDNYYLSIKNNANNDCMSILADLSIDNTVATRQDFVKEDPSVRIISIKGGILISHNNIQPKANVCIYSITGQSMECVNISVGEPKFVPLAAGFYLVNGQKVMVE